MSEPVLDWDAGSKSVVDLDIGEGVFLRDMDEIDRAYLTKDQAALLVQLNPKTIEREIQRGVIPAFRLANRIRIRRADLEAWIEASRVEPSIHDI